MGDITFEQVWKVYPDGTEAVRSVDLEIEDGSLMVLVGPSGCGKTTLLRMVAGLEEVTAGTIRIGDRAVNDVPAKSRDIAMVFQNYALYPHMSVYDNQAFGLRLRRVPPAPSDTPRGGGGGGRRPSPRAAGDRPARGGGRRRARPLRPAGEEARPVVRRPAPARGDGPRDRPPARGLPDGRAAVEPRREAARADALGDLAHAARPRHDDDLRHARPDRGDDDGYAGRRDEARRPPAGRHARHAVLAPRQRLRGRLHRLAGHELRQRAPGGLRRRAV